MPVLRFWINAFIPKTVPGYTQVLPGGTHSGKTAIPRPNASRLWPGNTFTHLDCGFLTDQRDFNSTYGASSRMTSMIEIETDYLDAVRQDHTSSGTTQVDLKTGAQTDYQVANMTRCRFVWAPKPGGGHGMVGAHFAAGRGGTTFPTQPAIDPRPASFSAQLSAAAGDPCVGMAADIDYNGTVTVSRNAPGGPVTVRFNGMIDAFPAYDCYASMNGRTQTMFTSAPPAGNTVMDLLGGANRAVSGVAVF